MPPFEARSRARGRRATSDVEPHRGTNRGWWIGAAVSFGAALAVLTPNVFRADPIYGFDTVVESFFWRSWAYGRVAHGEWPVWCAGLAGGFPLIAEPIAQFWYPPVALLHLVFAPAIALNLGWLVHFAWAGAGVFALLRDRGIRGSAALVGAIAYGVGGFMVGHLPMGGMPHVSTCAWTPWIFRYGLRLVERPGAPDPRSVALSAVTVAGGILAGHEQFQYATILALGFFVCAGVARPVGVEREHDDVAGSPWRRGAALVLLALAVALGVALASVIVVPYAEFLAGSNKGADLAGDFATFGARLLPSQLLGLVAPRFFGDSAATPYWGFPTRESVTLFLGAVPLALACTPVPPRARHEGWALRALAILGIVLALGPATPVLGWFREWLPLFGRARHPARWLHVSAFALAWLSAWGAETLLDAVAGKPTRWLRGRFRATGLEGFAAVCAVMAATWVVFAPVSGGAARFAGLVRATIEESSLPETEPLRHADPAALRAAWTTAQSSLGSSTAFALGAALLAAIARFSRKPQAMTATVIVVLTFLDLTSYGRSLVTTFPATALPWPTPVRAALAPPDPAHRLASTVTGNVLPFPPAFRVPHATLSSIGQIDMHRGLLDGFLSAQGGIPTTPRDWLDLAIGRSAYDMNDAPVGPGPIQQLLAVRDVLTSPGDRPRGPGWSATAMSPSGWLWRQDRALARATLVHACVPVSTRAEALVALRSRRADPARVSFAERACPPGIEPATSSRDAVRWITATDERIQLEVETTSGSLLRIADNAFPGWSATIDGQRAPIGRVDLALRGVVVPAGKHEVVMAYDSLAPRLGLGLSLVTALALLGMARLPARNRRRQLLITSTSLRQRPSSRPGTNGQ